MSKIPVSIPKTEFESGLNKSITNGDELLNISKCLHDNGKYPYAVYLAYMAMEEYGKALLFLDDKLDKSKNYISSTRWDKYYCKHEKKADRVKKEVNSFVKVYVGKDNKKKLYDNTNFYRNYIRDKKWEVMFVNYKEKNGGYGFVTPQDKKQEEYKTDSETAISIAGNAKWLLLQSMKNRYFDYYLKHYLKNSDE